MQTSFWSGKKVFLTGHTGFKGSWLSLWLQKMGAELVGYSLEPPTQPNLFNLANVNDQMISIIGDIRDAERLNQAITQHQPEIIFHMAAQPLVRYSYDFPVETYATNVMGTVNVLEAIRQSNSVRVGVIITTDKCYENREWVWGYRENEPMGGHDPYSSSKACAELVTAAYRSSFFSKTDISAQPKAIASARAGNVIGGGDWALDRLIPDIMRAITQGESVIIRNPNAIRPWQHVLEPLRGYLTLAEALWESDSAYADAWNFGPNDEDAKPVSWIVERLTKLWGEGARWELDTTANPHEANYLKLDCSKAKAQLKWHPTLALEDTLDWIVEWYRHFLRGENVRQITENQIARYESL